MSNNLTQYIVRVQDQSTAPLNNIRNASDRLTGSFRGMGSTLQGLVSEMPAMGGAMAALANPITLVSGALIAVGTTYVGAVKKSLEWQESMSKVNVTAQLSQDKLLELSNQLRDIGSKNTSNLAGVPDAFNRIISAGLDTNTALQALEPTLRAAKAGFTEVETVAAAGVATMASSGDNINKVYDVLFATMKEGNTEFKDIANYMPKLVPLARNVGFALEEVAGAYASLTGKLSAEQSTTALEGIMRSLSNPKIVSEMEKMGIQVFDKATGAVKPLETIISDMESKFAGLSDNAKSLKFADLKLDQSALLGFSVLTQDVEGLKKAIDATTNSQGALNKAYEDAATPLDSWAIIGNKVQVVMLKLGDYALPIIDKIGNAILGVVDYFTQLYNESYLFRELLSGIGFVFEKIFEYAFFGFKRAIDTIKGVGQILGWLGEKLGITGLSFSKIGDFATEMYIKAKPYILYVYEMFSKIAEIGNKIATLQWADAANLIDNFTMPVLNDLKQRVQIEAAYKPAENSTESKFGASFAVKKPVTNAPEKLDKDIKTAAQAGTRSTSINISIGKFQDSINVYSTGVQETSKGIQDTIEEGILRALAMAGATGR